MIDSFCMPSTLTLGFQGSEARILGVACSYQQHTVLNIIKHTQNFIHSGFLPLLTRHYCYRRHQGLTVMLTNSVVTLSALKYFLGYSSTMDPLIIKMWVTYIFSI